MATEWYLNVVLIYMIVSIFSFAYLPSINLWWYLLNFLTISFGVLVFLLLCWTLFNSLGRHTLLDMCITNIFPSLAYIHSINGVFWRAEVSLLITYNLSTCSFMDGTFVISKKSLVTIFDVTSNKSKITKFSSRNFIDKVLYFGF